MTTKLAERSTMSDAGCERFIEETRDASPANLLTKFESFSSFAKCGIAQYESRAFEAGGYKWKMILYPESDEEECHVSVHFTIAETESLPAGWKVDAIFAFFVYNPRMKNYLCFRGTTRLINALNPKCGFSKLISKKALMDSSKGFVVDDSCVFGAEVFVINNPPINGCLSLVKDTAPFKREWKISGVSQLGYVWNSEEFVVGNHKWKVTAYSTNQYSRPEGPYMSFYLKCIDAVKFGPLKKVKAEMCMRIRNKPKGTHESIGFASWYTSESVSWGFPEYISSADMSKLGYLIDECFFLEVEICVHAVVLDAPKI